MATTGEKTAGLAAPRPRRKTAGVSAAELQAWRVRAQEWLRERGGVVTWPEDLAAVVKLGVPCPSCGLRVHRLRQDGHSVFYRRVPGGHWADGVAVECRR